MYKHVHNNTQTGSPSRETMEGSLVPRPICGRGKNGLVSIVCACAEYPTIRGVSDLYVNSPCNFPLYFTHTLVYCGLAGVSVFPLPQISLGTRLRWRGDLAGQSGTTSVPQPVCDTCLCIQHLQKRRDYITS